MGGEFLQSGCEALGVLLKLSGVGLACIIGGAGLACIIGGAFSMMASGKRRDREMGAAEWAGALRKQGEVMAQAFTQQGQVLVELLRRTA